jgi:hypothetical protein
MAASVSNAAEFEEAEVREKGVVLRTAQGQRVSSERSNSFSVTDGKPLEPLSGQTDLGRLAHPPSFSRPSCRCHFARRFSPPTATSTGAILMTA